MPKFPHIRICWVSNTYPTFRTAATNRRIDTIVDPSVDPARMSLKEPFRGIDDDMNSTSGSLTGCRSGGKTRRFYRARRLEWKIEKPKATTFHSWMHGGHVEHVEHFEICREHFWKPSSCKIYRAFSTTCRKFSKIGKWSVLHTAYSVASLRTKKGHLQTHRNPWLPRFTKNTWRDAHPLSFNLSTCEFWVLSRKHRFMVRSYQKHPLLWKHCFFTDSPFQGAF